MSKNTQRPLQHVDHTRFNNLAKWNYEDFDFYFDLFVDVFAEIDSSIKKYQTLSEEQKRALWGKLKKEIDEEVQHRASDKEML